VVTRTPCATPAELNAAVAAAKAAFPKWRNTPVSQRQRVLFKFVRACYCCCNLVLCCNGRRALFLLHLSTKVCST
jgi:hypothetical protein